MTTSPQAGNAWDWGWRSRTARHFKIHDHLVLSVNKLLFLGVEYAHPLGSCLTSRGDTLTNMSWSKLLK